jgi:hypothetical protein
VDYDLDSAVRILRELHARMKAADRKSKPPAMADLEIAGQRTGAVRVLASKWLKRRKSAGGRG